MALIQCPVCGHKLEEDEVEEQAAHMESYHPEIIKQRLEREGLWDRRNNRPYYPRDKDPLIGYK